MRQQVESILGYPIPKECDFVLQSGVIRNWKAINIARKIKEIVDMSKHINAHVKQNKKEAKS